MTNRRFGNNFRRLFAAAILQEMSFSLLIHLPGYFNDLGATEAIIGVLYSVSAVLSLVFRPWLGRILDLTHRRTVLLVAAIINVAVIVLLATTTVWGPYLWGIFLVQRTIQIALFTTMLTYGADSIPIERRTQGLAMFGLTGLIPLGLGGFFGDVIISEGGFNALFYTAAAVSLASWLAVWTLPTLPVRGRQPRRSFWAAFVQKSLLPLWFATFLFSVGIESMFTFIRTFVVDRDVGTTGLFLGVYGLVAAVTRVIGGQLYDKIPHRPLLTGSIAAYGVGLGVLAAAFSVPVMLLAAVVTGTAHGAAFPLLSSEVVNRARVSERGSAMATFTSLFDIALLAGAPIVGLMIERISYFVAFLTVGLLVGMGAFIYRVWDMRLDPSTLVAEKTLE